MKTILQAKDVNKTFGTKGNLYTALQHISLSIEEGEFVGIMGPSGAGKFTLLNIFSTIDTPSSGEIIIDGQNIVSISEEKLSDFRRNKLGFIFQNYNLLDTLTVKENILLPLALSKVPSSEIERRVNDIADTFGIRAILKKYPYQISGGQKQRAAASRAIVANPSLILADEYDNSIQAASVGSPKISSAFSAAAVVLIIFVAIFIWYSNSFFTRKRKKEVGLYSLLSVRKKQIGRMLFYENFLMGIVALIVGIALGSVLSRFFVLILMKVMGYEAMTDFSISMAAIINTFVVFMIITLITSLQGYRLIYRFAGAHRRSEPFYPIEK